MVWAWWPIFRAIPRGKRVEQIRGTGTLPNFFRKPYGDGWALVGDAGYPEDPILAQEDFGRVAVTKPWRMLFTPDFRPPSH
jgi:hypothetical protein